MGETMTNSSDQPTRRATCEWFERGRHSAGTVNWGECRGVYPSTKMQHERPFPQVFDRDYCRHHVYRVEPEPTEVDP